MDIEMKYIIPLIGVFLGWILSTLTSLFKEQNENQRRLGKAIVRLDNFNHEKIKLIRHIEYLKDLAGINKEFEDLRKRAWGKYVFPEDDYKAIQESIDDISGLYPMIGIKLKVLVDSHLFSKKMKFDNSVANSFDTYIKLLSAFEATFELEQKEVQKVLFKLCFKHGIITWLRMKRKYIKFNKNQVNGVDILDNLNSDKSDKQVINDDSHESTVEEKNDSSI